MSKFSTSMLAAVALFLAGAPAAVAGPIPPPEFLRTLPPVIVLGTQTITYEVDLDAPNAPVGGIASIMITGPVTGANGGGVTLDPPGWVFDGDIDNGNYSWKTNPDGNLTTGTFDFTVTLPFVSGLAPANDVFYDVRNPDGSHTSTKYTLPAGTPPTLDNYAFVPVPEPSSFLLLGVGVAGTSIMARTTRHRKLRA